MVINRYMHLVTILISVAIGKYVPTHLYVHTKKKNVPNLLVHVSHQLNNIFIYIFTCGIYIYHCRLLVCDILIYAHTRDSRFA
jgi:uncharacterized membrane protein